MPITFNEEMQSLADRYLAEHGQAATAHEMALWALENHLWEMPRSAVVQRCADEFARAMREDHITDRQGRSVRAKHVARVERDGQHRMEWADIRAATPEHMQMAFRQRRNQIVGDCRQLKTDVDSYNENWSGGQVVQMGFDFTFDLLELEMAIAS